MANNLNVGDTVYVPCSLFPDELESFETALYKTKVESKSGKSVTVRLPGGVESKAVGASRLHKDVGLLLIELGDFDSEAATLDPLAKSVLQFCRLLVPDDQIRSVKVRSLAELAIFWKKNQAAYSHVILVGHGDSDELGFAVDGSVKLATFAEALKIKKATPKLFISLACKTGYQSFGGEFSKETICQNFIGPFHSVHSAIASQFCQTLLTAHFLDGKTTKVAFRHARDSVPGGVSFRLWRNGTLVTDAAPKQ
jgi:hypothetical protein